MRGSLQFSAVDGKMWGGSVRFPPSSSKTRWQCSELPVQISRSVMSDSLQPHGLQQARPPCPSQFPGACSNLMSAELVIPSNYLILCRPLLLLPSIFPSIRVFSNESGLHIRWPKYQSFSLSISPSNEY